MPFQPAFAPSTDPIVRFQQLRTFLSRWFGVSLPPAGGGHADAERLSRELGRPLGPAVTEWVALTADLQGPATCGVLRDGRRIADWPEHACLSLNLQAEQDVHWAVRYEDLGAGDPPVSMYWRDFDAEPLTFRACDEDTGPTSVTVFGIGYLLSYTRGSSGFGRSIDDRARLAEQLEAAGIMGTTVGDIWIGEGEGWFALIDAMWTEPAFTFTRRGDVDVPPPIAALAGGPGWRMG